MKPRNTSAFVLIVATLFLSCASIVSAQDDAGGSGHIFLPMVLSTNSTTEATVLSVTASVPAQSAALAYWTRGRMANASTMVMPSQYGPAEVDMPDPAEPESAGAPIYVPPTLPARNAEQIARAAYAADWDIALPPEEEFDLNFAPEELLLEPSAADGTRRLYTSYIANWVPALQGIPPHRWVGRLYFTTPTGGSWCTATSIRGNNVVTAAHCVYDTFSANRWYKDFVFAPAYRVGSTPFGTFPWTGCTILKRWADLGGNFNLNTWARSDLAVCTVGKNSAGQTLSQAVGSAAYLMNIGYTRSIFNLGYPAQDYRDQELSWPGEYLRLCAAETFTQATDVRGMGCNWGGGMSGGPWIDKTSLSSLTFGTKGYWPGRSLGAVVGVNSGGFVNTDNMYGGRFTSNNLVPICDVRGC